MNYVLKSSIHKKKISFPLKVTVVFSIVCVGIYFFVPNFLPSVATSLFSSLLNVQKNVELRTLGPSTIAENYIIEELRKENEELKKNFGRDSTIPTTLAYILKKPPYTLYDSYILDVGSANDIFVGNRVYVPGNILVGEIVHVDTNTSRVRLYSSYGEKFEAFVGEKKIQTTAVGRGGGSFEAVLPRDVSVAKGDVVTVPHISGSVFAIVEDIILDASHSFSTIIFSQPVNIYEQKWVMVEEGHVQELVPEPEVASTTKKK